MDDLRVYHYFRKHPVIGCSNFRKYFMFAAPSHFITYARPSAPSEPWYATVLLKSSAGERLEGAAMGLSSQAAGSHW